ncbi:MAG TPA: DUF6508 domain-containing protein [Candidatus Limnocylindrales bacterium]|nr:DUF6508 domain-containing protein [Candidatus Limnocylindrales bacterium]
MDTNPQVSDEEILVRLEAAPEERWTELGAAADALAALPAVASWDDGRGQDGGVTHMPYVTYDDAVYRLTDALSGVTGGILVFDWGTWGGLERYERGAGLDEAPVTEAARLVTAVVRSERFSEGAIEDAIESGMVGAIVRRLWRWHDEGSRHQTGQEPASGGVSVDA